MNPTKISVFQFKCLSDKHENQITFNLKLTGSQNFDYGDGD